MGWPKLSVDRWHIIDEPCIIFLADKGNSHVRERCKLVKRSHRKYLYGMSPVGQNFSLKNIVGRLEIWSCFISFLTAANEGRVRLSKGWLGYCTGTIQIRYRSKAHKPRYFLSVL